MNRLIGRVKMISQEDTDDFGKELECYEVQVWLPIGQTATPDDELESDMLGCFDEMFEFNNYNEAVKKYNEIENYRHIILMKYESRHVDADGYARFEDSK